MEEKGRPFGPERQELSKAYVYDRLEGTKVLSEGIRPIDDRTLLTIHFPENRAFTFVKSTDQSVKDKVESQLQKKGITYSDDDLILQRLIPAHIMLLMRTGQFKEKKLEKTLRLDRIP